jgi:hypothetical protein
MRAGLLGSKPAQQTFAGYRSFDPSQLSLLQVRFPHGSG